MSNERWEVVTATDGTPLGAVVRVWNTERLATWRVFADQWSRSVISLDGAAWVHCSYTEDDSAPVELDAVTLLEDEDAIPSDLEYLLLLQAIRDIPEGDDSTVSYHVIFAGDPGGRAREASMWQPEPGVWEIEVDGELEQTFWTESHEVIRSQGHSLTYTPATREAVLDTLSGVVHETALRDLAADITQLN